MKNADTVATRPDDRGCTPVASFVRCKLRGGFHTHILNGITIKGGGIYFKMDVTF